MRKRILFCFLVILLVFPSFGYSSNRGEQSNTPIPEYNRGLGGSGSGGGTVPITTIELDERRVEYNNIKPSRMKFEFNGKLYAIQLRRVKQEYADFLIMTLDMNKPGDITAHVIDDSFSLSLGEIRKIDVDKDGAKDIAIELNDITNTGKYGSVRSASFFIKKINLKIQKITPINKEVELEQKPIAKIIDEPIGGNLETTILKEELIRPTLLSRIFNLFRDHFSQ